MYKNNKTNLFIVIGIILALAFFVGWTMFKNNASITTSNGQGLDPNKKHIVIAVHWTSSGYYGYQINGIYKDGKLTHKGLKQYTEDYMKLHPDVQIEIKELVPREYHDKLKVLSDIDNAPDIYQIYSQQAARYVNENILDKPPTDIVEDVQQNYISTAGVTVNGEIWGIPTEINDYVLVYNKKAFREAGITAPPKTWNELASIAVRLTNKGATGKTVRYGIAWARDDFEIVGDSFAGLLFSNNGKYITDDYKQVLVNSPAGVEVLQAQVDLFKKGASNIDANFYDFPKGEAAMVIAPPWVKNSWKQSYGDKFEQEVGVAPLPYFKKPATFQYSWFTGVMNKSKQKEEAWKFLKWMTAEVQPETNTTRLGDLLTNNIGAIPSRKIDLENQKELKDFFSSVYVKELPNAMAVPNVLGFQDIRLKLMTEIQNAWQGKKTAKTALDDAAKEMNQILSTYYK